MGTVVEAIKARHIFYGWWIVLVGFLALVVSGGASAWGFSVIVKPMSQDLGWSRSQIFSVVTVSSLMGGIASPIIGRLVDRYGARTIMVICACIAGAILLICSQIRGTSAQFFMVPFSLLQFILLFGVIKGMAMPGLGVGPNTAVANWFIRKRGRAFALLSTGSPVSGMIFPPLVTWIIAVSNWRLAWAMMGLIPLIVVAPMAWRFIRRRPEDVGLKPDGDEGVVSAGTTRMQPGRTFLQPHEEFTAKEALRTRTFWIFTIAFALEGIPLGTIFLHMPSYYTDHGLSAATAASLLSLYAAGAFVARGVWGFLAERAPIQYLLVLHAVIYGVFIIIFLLVGVKSVLLLYIPVLFLGVGAGGSMQLDAQAWADFFGRREIGSIMGLWSLFRTGVSSFGPLFAAMMFDAFGSYTVPFSIFSALCLMASVLLLFARQPKKPAPASNLR